MESFRWDLLNDTAEPRSILNITKIRTTALFFTKDQCSATSMESFRRDLRHDMAENRSTLKTNKKIVVLCFQHPYKENNSLNTCYIKCDTCLGSYFPSRKKKNKKKPLVRA